MHFASPKSVMYILYREGANSELETFRSRPKLRRGSFTQTAGHRKRRPAAPGRMYGTHLRASPRVPRAEKGNCRRERERERPSPIMRDPSNNLSWDDRRSPGGVTLQRTTRTLLHDSRRVEIVQSRRRVPSTQVQCLGTPTLFSSLRKPLTIGWKSAALRGRHFVTVVSLVLDGM